MFQLYRGGMRKMRYFAKVRTHYLVTKIQHIMYIDKDYSIIYNDIYNYSVHPAICEGWHVTHMLKTLAYTLPCML
jgi:hypothetical protein